MQNQSLTKLKEDNEQLYESLHGLNQCYGQKTLLMEQTISHYQQRCQSLLEQQQEIIESSMAATTKHESQIKNLMYIIDEIHGKFQQERQTIQEKVISQGEQIERQREKIQRQGEEIERKEKEIKGLKEGNCELGEQLCSEEGRVQSLAQQYMGEIDRLKIQLNELRGEQSINQLREQQSEGNYDVLKDISLKNNQSDKRLGGKVVV